MIGGLSERHLDAQRAFIEAYELEGSDIDLANAVVSYYSLGDFQTALDIPKDDFDVFSDEAKRVIVLNTEEAVRMGGLTYFDLPHTLVVLMKELKAGYR